MANDKIKVLYIAGEGRSGSTILHNILGQIEGFSAFGELRYIWERGLVKHLLCGCGDRIHDCVFWNEVFDKAYGGFDGVNAQEMSELTESFRVPHLPQTYIPSLRRKHMERLKGYQTNLEKLYRAIVKVTGSNVIVDSSKNASYGYVLNNMSSIDLYVLQVTRDSRAVAYSWSKRKEFEAGVMMARKSPVKSAVHWSARNFAVDLFLKETPERYMKLRYEDYVVDPLGAVESIVSFVNEQPENLPFVNRNTAELNQVNHSVFGNPVRFQSGQVTIRLDNKWQTKMSGRDQRTVSAITWPLQIKYGYRLSGSQDDAKSDARKPEAHTSRS